METFSFLSNTKTGFCLFTFLKMHVLAYFYASVLLICCSLELGASSGSNGSPTTESLHYANFEEEDPGPMDCLGLKELGNTASGIYRIWPLNWKFDGSFSVYCDMDTDGGGWTLIQRRGNYGNPKDYFFKTWEEYAMGFGDLNGEFWLGNERIFALTNQAKYALRISLKSKEGETRYAHYTEFWIESEKYMYKLHISGFSGNAGDSMDITNGMKFTTKDRDNDAKSWDNCANEYKGGWWYERCHKANLNGLNLDGVAENSKEAGITWWTWKGYDYSMHEVVMEIRRLE